MRLLTDLLFLYVSDGEQNVEGLEPNFHGRSTLDRGQIGCTLSIIDQGRPLGMAIFFTSAFIC